MTPAVFDGHRNNGNPKSLKFKWQSCLYLTTGLDP